MSDAARNRTTPTVAQTKSTATDTAGYGFCAWHQRFARGVRLVQLADEGSGPNNRGLFACPSCRELYELVPLADRSL